MTKVIDIGGVKDRKRKDNLLEVLNEVKQRIESDEIEEFVMSSIDKDGEIKIHVCVKDMVGGVGLFEIGKTILFEQHAMGDYE
jgi:hypothetical protein